MSPAGMPVFSESSWTVAGGAAARSSLASLSSVSVPKMAATIVTRDPVFGWTAYGGTKTERGGALEVIPQDGLRRRFGVVVPDPALPFSEDLRRFRIELERDGFAAGVPVRMDKDLARIGFVIENRTGSGHRSGVKLSFPVPSKYELRQEGKAVALVPTGDWDYPWRAEVDVPAGGTEIELVRTDRDI